MSVYDKGRRYDGFEESQVGSVVEQGTAVRPLGVEGGRGANCLTAEAVEGADV